MCVRVCMYMDQEMDGKIHEGQLRQMYGSRLEGWFDGVGGWMDA